MTKQNFHSHIVVDKAITQHLLPKGASSGGNAEVFEQLLPELYGLSDKKRQQLEKVDHYMLLETKELYARLKAFCNALHIDTRADFRIARDIREGGKNLIVLDDIPNREALNTLINRDSWFVDSFLWLQPNYSLLAHSFEMLEFSEYYERAPHSAIAKYAHFDRDDKGALFAIRFAQGRVNAQVETPVNLYCV